MIIGACSSFKLEMLVTFRHIKDTLKSSSRPYVRAHVQVTFSHVPPVSSSFTRSYMRSSGPEKAK